MDRIAQWRPIEPAGPEGQAEPNQGKADGQSLGSWRLLLIVAIGVSLFLDVGSVWDEGRDNEVRFSAGLGFQGGPAFLTVGFPLNTDTTRAVVTVGLRVPGMGIRW